MNQPTIQIQNAIRGDWLTEHHFTDSARRSIRDAESRAYDRGMFGRFPPLLILWAMLRWERKVGVIALEGCGVDLARLERDTEMELERFPEGTWRDGVDLIHLKAVAERAPDEAKRLGHDYVGSEHLVLALCRDPDEAVLRVFKKHDVSHEKYAESVRKVFEIRDRAT